VLEAEEVLNVQRGRLVKARPFGVVRMGVVATPLEDFDARREALVDRLDAQRAVGHVQEVVLQEVHMVHANQLFEDVRRVDRQLAASARVSLGPVLQGLVLNDLTVQDDGHLRACGKPPLIGLQ